MQISTPANQVGKEVFSGGVRGLFVRLKRPSSSPLHIARRCRKSQNAVFHMNFSFWFWSAVSPFSFSETIFRSGRNFRRSGISIHGREASGKFCWVTCRCLKHYLASFKAAGFQHLHTEIILNTHHVSISTIKLEKLWKKNPLLK